MASYSNGSSGPSLVLDRRLADIKASVRLDLRNETARRLFRLIAPIVLVEQSLDRSESQRHTELSESQFIALAALRSRGSMFVGEIQHFLGITFPPLMSRIITCLKNREVPLITCRRRVGDKRKIDVTLTEAGATALDEYEKSRVHEIEEMLSRLSSEELENFRCIMARLRGRLCLDGER